MAKHYSSYFKRRHKDFVKKGVFDGFIGKDARLHVDPLLLKYCTTPEFIGAYNKLLNYFKKLVHLVPQKDEKITQLRYKSIVEHLTFPEFYFIGLGFGDNSKAGKGLTGKKSEQLAETAIEIIQDGYVDPEIFLLVYLFQEKIGADGISDMMIWTLQDEFISYTKRIAKEFGLKTHLFDKIYELPYFYASYKGVMRRTPIIFVPTEIIRNLPKAEYRDGHFYSDYNNEIRRRISKDIGIALKDMNDKKLVREKLLGNPKAISNMVDMYRHLKGQPYDFNQDEKYIYATAIIEELIGKEPMPLRAKEDSLEAVLYIARQICLQYKKLIEDNRMSDFLYFKGQFKGEKVVQKLFMLMADAYCNISGIDLSAEPNYGIGPVDFKFSSGYHCKVLLEMKLVKNTHFLHGLEVQLPAYLKAESTSKGIYMIIKTEMDDDLAVSTFWEKVDLHNLPKSLHDNVIVIDARKRTSASKL